MSYTHLLFDHDGVLVNTEPLYLQAIQEQLATLGITLRETDYIQNMAVGADPWALARAAGCGGDRLFLLHPGDRVAGRRRLPHPLQRRGRSAQIACA